MLCFIPVTALLKVHELRERKAWADRLMTGLGF